MRHYFTKVDKAEIPLLWMTCREPNIIQLSNFAVYLSIERELRFCVHAVIYSVLFCLCSEIPIKTIKSYSH